MNMWKWIASIAAYVWCISNKKISQIEETVGQIKS